MSRNRFQAKAFAFLENIKDHEGDACVAWPFHRFTNGYPKLNYEGRSLVASRLLCEKVHGPPSSPEDEAAHSCGNGGAGCVNPNHVRWLSPKANQMERIVHGTSNRGDRHGMAKLNAEKVLEIYARLQRGQTQNVVASLYGVSQTAISEIWTGKTWSWLIGRAA